MFMTIVFVKHHKKRDLKSGTCPRSSQLMINVNAIFVSFDQYL